MHMSGMTHPKLVAELEGSLQERLQKQHVGAPCTVLEGLVPCVEAVRIDADLIVAGRERRQKPILGNLYEIVREAPCPVLAI